MAIKPIPPALRLQGVDWQLMQPAQVNRSGYTGARKVMGLPGGARWLASVTLVPFADDRSAAVARGWLASLEGQVHTFYLPVLDAQHNGANPTASVAAGAVQATLSAAIGLKAGQFLTFTLASGKRQMVMLTRDMEGTLATFRPMLREAATGTVESRAPYCEVALDSDTVAWMSRPGRMFEFPAFGVEEAY